MIVGHFGRISPPMTHDHGIRRARAPGAGRKGLVSEAWLAAYPLAYGPGPGGGI